MKRIVALVVAVMVSVCITACNSDNGNKKSAAEQYRSVAQQYIDKGDTETAKKALEEGISLTNDEGLKKMLEEISDTESIEEKTDTESVEKEDVKTTEEVVETPKASETLEVVETADTTDYTSYIGTWSTNEFSWEDGGVTMTVSMDDEYLYITCDSVQCAPMNRIAHFEDKIPFSKIVDSKVTTYFTDDCWGNRGTVVLKFAAAQDYYIVCSFKDIIYSDMAMWGFHEGEFMLFKD